MKFKKGNKLAKGRPRGAKSKLSESFYQDCLAAYNNPRVGGLKGLIEWIASSQHNRVTFYGWLSKTMPSNLHLGNASSEDGTDKEFVVRVIHVHDDEGGNDHNK